MSIAISAEGLGKQYWRAARVAHHNSLREALTDAVKNLTARREQSRASTESFWAVKDVSFKIKHGENVGIIGLNGAGKSTLLKLLSRIASPTAGKIRLEGRLGALLEVGTGFHRELTGRENIFLYGSILGMSRQEIAAKFDAIVAFSEIGDFIDMPVKRYSSGMYVRLAFSVAAHLEPDILLLDEVLAVGDYGFQKKCIDFALRLQRNGATIILVSHNMFSIKMMCKRVIYIKQGRVAFDGPTDEGLRLYEADSYLTDSSWFHGNKLSPIDINSFEILDASGEPRTLFEYGDRLRVRLRYTTSAPMRHPQLRFSITRSDDVLCCNFSSLLDGADLSDLGRQGTVELLTPPLKLVADSYAFSVTVVGDDGGQAVAAKRGPRFHVAHPDLSPSVFGVFHEPGQWSLLARDRDPADPVYAQ